MVAQADDFAEAAKSQVPARTLHAAWRQRSRSQSQHKTTQPNGNKCEAGDGPCMFAMLASLAEPTARRA
eukprot:12687559-Alexandrium_andersonii.AAC.1